ncbi:DUF7504 family protein [Haloplanus sp. C73]|uniref:DUF7504 family protein n=1 Tax=Haloplanus sp. C73 TaxID=3421641 RepID=UPI003EBBE623
MGGADGDESGGVHEASRPSATLLLADAEATVDAHLDVVPAATNVLVVTTGRSMRDVVESWRRRAGIPATLGIVTYAEFDRSASRDAGDASPPARRSLSGGDITLTSMSDPSNLQRLGTAVTLHLDEWEDTDRETLVYLDALGPFIDASDTESAFQFLHLLVQSAEQLSAEVLVRIDPEVVDERTIRTVQSLFDAVLEPEADDIDFQTLLANRRRRFVLRALLEESSVGLERLATRLARREADTEWDRAYTALASIHVPRLAEAGVVTFDRENGVVRLADGNWSVERLERRLDEEFDD